ncbi:MAG: DUF4355 domain-containing protein [Candidatus Fimousia sp.]
MAEFTAITTQEEFDKAVEARLKAERETIGEKYKGYLSPEEVGEKYKGYLSPEDAAEKDKKIKKYETDSVKTRVAHEMGLSYEAAEFLRGEDEETIKKSAESLKALVGEQHSSPPLFRTEPAGDGKKNAEREALKTMLSDMKGE